MRLLLPSIWAIALCCLVPLSALQADTEILGDDYRQMPPAEQRALVTGLWYGVTLWSYHIEYSAGTKPGSEPARNPENRWLAACNENKTPNDMSDLYNQYLDSHPELWHFDIGTLFVFALQEHCSSENSELATN